MIAFKLKKDARMVRRIIKDFEDKKITMEEMSVKLEEYVTSVRLQSIWWASNKYSKFAGTKVQGLLELAMKELD